MVLAVVVAVVIAVVFTVWVIWAGPGQTSHGLDSEDVGYKVMSDRQTVVHTQLSADPGTRVACTVKVLNKAYAVVGWKQISLPASDQRMRAITTDVKTSERGVTGLINECWVP